MKRIPTLLTISLLTTCTLLTFHAAAQSLDTGSAVDDGDEDVPVLRVARLSFIEGDVSFLRAGSTEWASAAENLPLLAGDQVYTGGRARAEIQIGRGNYLRLSERTAVTISDLSEKIAQFEVTEGIAIVRLDRLASEFERFEVDTPNAALSLERDGLYRVNVRGADDCEVIVRRGSAEVSTTDGSFRVREGHRLLVDTSPTGRLEIALDNPRDDWDRWSYDRDATIDRITVASSPDYINSFESSYSGFYGVSELASYGSWTSDSTYGDCWIPRGISSGWAPYRHGEWIWIPSAGWTWLSTEPWGWAPYHYGRWVYISSLGWAWAPGFRSRYYAYNPWYYRWRPSLVHFFTCPTPYGDYVGWYPLRPGERWYRSGWAGRGPAPAYSSIRGGSRRADGGPSSGWAHGRPGTSVIPVDAFGGSSRGRVRPQAPTGDIGGWVGRNSRPGLPEIRLVPSAGAPAWGGRSRPVVTPPGDVVNRPVVTRNRPSDPQIESAAPRERRVLSPKRVRDLTEVPTPVGRADGAGSRTRSRADDDGAGSGRLRPGRADASDSNSGGDASGEDRGRERDRSNPGWRRAPDGSSPSGGSGSNGSSSGADNSDQNSGRKERERLPRYVPVPAPRSDNADSNTRQRGGDEQNRDQRSGWGERSRPRDDGQSRSNERARPHDGGQSHSNDRARSHDGGGNSAGNSQPRSERAQPPSQRNDQPRHDGRSGRRPGA